MIIKWTDIKGYEGLYQISSKGDVYSHYTKKILKPSINSHGYIVYCLVKDGKRKNHKGHRLVAEHFIPNPLNLETVDHKNNNKQKNEASNLQWMTNAANIKKYWEYDRYLKVG